MEKKQKKKKQSKTNDCPSLWFEKAARTCNEGGPRKYSIDYCLSWENRAECLGRPRWLEFMAQITGGG